MSEDVWKKEESVEKASASSVLLHETFFFPFSKRLLHVLGSIGGVPVFLVRFPTSGFGPKKKVAGSGLRRLCHGLREENRGVGRIGNRTWRVQSVPPWMYCLISGETSLLPVRGIFFSYHLIVLR